VTADASHGQQAVEILACIVETTDTGHLIPIGDPEAVVNGALRVLRVLRRQYRKSLR
jgi:hypothetical protein